MARGSKNNDTPDGWYPDPEAAPGTTQLRYWAAGAWTKHVHASEPSALPSQKVTAVEPAPTALPAGPEIIAGYSGQISFDGQFVTILRKGFRARATVGKGEKRLPLHSISAVQWKPAGPFVNGFIQFTVGGGNERRSSFGSQTTLAASDENSVVFTKAQMPAFVTLRAQIETAIADRHRPVAAVAPVAAGPSVAQQLRELAELHNAGVLDEAEFAQAKSRLISGS